MVVRIPVALAKVHMTALHTVGGLVLMSGNSWKLEPLVKLAEVLLTEVGRRSDGEESTTDNEIVLEVRAEDLAEVRRELKIIDASVCYAADTSPRRLESAGDSVALVGAALEALSAAQAEELSHYTN